MAGDSLLPADFEMMASLRLAFSNGPMEALSMIGGVLEVRPSAAEASATSAALGSARVCRMRGISIVCLSYIY